MGWMEPVIFPESATSDQSNPLRSLPKAGTWIVYVLYFPAFGWEHWGGRL